MKFRFEFMSQTQLGKLFGVSNQMVGKWLSNLGMRVGGEPSTKALELDICKRTLSREGHLNWVWHSERTVVLFKDAGHFPLLCPPVSLAYPPILNGSFSIRTTTNSICVVANGDGTECIWTSDEMTAKVVASILNAAHKSGLLGHLCEPQRILQMSPVPDSEINSIVKPFE